MGGRFLVHLDDVGATSGSVLAWKVLRRAGVVRSASVMVPCAWYRWAVEDYLEDPDQDLGVHITLTSEWQRYRWRPLNGRAAGLVDEDGYFHRRPEDVVANASPAAVEDEISAQIERSLSDGIRPSHLDAHMGTAFLPPFAWTLLDLADQFDIALPVYRDLSALWHAVCTPAPDATFATEFVTEAARRGHPVFDRFAIGFADDSTEASVHYRNMLRGLDSGLTWLAIHAEAPCETKHFAPHMARARSQELSLFAGTGGIDIFPPESQVGLTCLQVSGATL